MTLTSKQLQFLKKKTYWRLIYDGRKAAYYFLVGDVLSSCYLSVASAVSVHPKDHNI